MIPDFVPHSNSLLIGLVGKGHIENLTFPIKDEEELKIEFNYRTQGSIIKVNYHFRFKAERPRDLRFKINELEFIKGARNESGVYTPYFSLNEIEIPFEDPLKVSIEKFISAVNETGDTLVTPQKSLDNIFLQDQILQAYNIS